jgi:hypothetical protein
MTRKKLLCVKAHEEASYYLTNGKSYDINSVEADGQAVLITDDEGDEIFIWTNGTSCHGQFKLL